MGSIEWPKLPIQPEDLPKIRELLTGGLSGTPLPSHATRSPARSTRTYRAHCCVGDKAQ